MINRILAIFSVAIVCFVGSRSYINYTNFKKQQYNTTKVTAEPKDCKVQTENLAEKTITKSATSILTLAYGGNFQKLMTSFGIDNGEAYRLASELFKHQSPRKLRAGQKFEITYDFSDGKKKITAMRTKIAEGETLIISSQDQIFTSKVNKIVLTKHKEFFETKVGGSFYQAALKQGLTPNATQRLITNLSYLVNFQHAIKENASFKLYCDVLKDPKGKIVKVEKFHSVELNTGQRIYKIYLFDDGTTKTFFDENGQSIVRSLLQTPIQAVKPRISSPFGMRRHPILGYSKKHTGVDFAAPTGTPVIAAGDGVVTFSGRKGGYGNCVKIRHANGMSTLYGHLNSIARNLKVGKRVNQQQIIGTVGMTGRATGPHLHYEVIKSNGGHINPMSVQGIPRIKLTGNALKTFKQNIQKIDNAILAYTSKAKNTDNANV